MDTAPDRPTLAAIVARLLPLGPGTAADLAPVVDHVVETFASPYYAAARSPIAAAVARLEELARERRGRAFAELPEAARDEVLRALEAEGSEPARLFFRVLVTLTLEASLRSPGRGGEPARRGRAHMGLDDPPRLAPAARPREQGEEGSGEPCRRR